MRTVLTRSARLRDRFRTRAVGALAAQVALAFGSFVLQALAARELGPAGLGTFALLFGALVMATAVTTGLLGDSLTVLDRHDPDVRAALGRMSWILIFGLSLIGFCVVVGRLPLSTALLFAVALSTFMLADLGRRLLMATLRFWSLVAVDGTAFVTTMIFLGAFAWSGPLRLNHFVAAVAINQAVACALALTRLPAAERRRPPRGPGAWRTVLAYGGWRAVQQFVRPTMLNLARWTVLVAAGAAAVGQLEAARVYVAPAMLLVQGFGSYLFSSYAADRSQGPARLLRRADRAAAIMIVGAVAVAGIAAALLPAFGDLLTAGRFHLSMVAILGWSCYAASCAAVLPYGSLAAVGGQQQQVLAIRLLDSLVSLALAGAALLIFDIGPEWLPWLLSAGSFVGGVLCRQVLLRPRVRAEQTS